MHTHTHGKKVKPLPKYDLKGIYPNKKCISSSQFKSYEESPAQFYLEYVLGIRKPPTVKMLQGVIFSALYADRTLDHAHHLHECGAPARVAEIFEKVIKRFPIQKGGQPEYPLKAKHRGWTFRATLDDYVHHRRFIVENKTGEAEWTQERVDADDQVTFQVWCHWKKHKEMPDGGILNWVDLRKNSTQRLKTFPIYRTVKQMLQFEERVNRVIDNLEANNFTTSLY